MIRKCGLLITLKNGPLLREVRGYSTLRNLKSSRQPLLYKVNPVNVPTRGFGMLIARVIKGVLKLRYIVIGSAVTGGYTLQKVCLVWYQCKCQG